MRQKTFKVSLLTKRRSFTFIYTNEKRQGETIVGSETEQPAPRK